MQTGCFYFVANLLLLQYDFLAPVVIAKKAPCTLAVMYALICQRAGSLFSVGYLSLLDLANFIQMIYLILLQIPDIDIQAFYLCSLSS